MANKNYHYINLFYYLYILLVFKIIFPSLFSSYECDFESPFLYNGDCISSCSPDYIENGICEVSNEKIKTQWFNNIKSFYNYNNNNEIMYDYVDICTTTNENLVLLGSSSIEEYKGNRILYILKENGRGFFMNDNNETPFHLFQTSLEMKTNGKIYSIKLNTNDDKEYIISISPNNIFEIYDIYNNGYNSIPLTTLFGKEYYYQDISAFIESGNNYFFGFIGKYGNNYHFYINKLSFSSIDLDKYSPIISSKSCDSSSSKIVSCYQTELKYIICFYQNYLNIYNVIAYDENTLNVLKEETIYDKGQNVDYFFKCVHFVREVGAFCFYSHEDNCFIFKFKSFNNFYLAFENYYQRDNMKTMI